MGLNEIPHREERRGGDQSWRRGQRRRQAVDRPEQIVNVRHGGRGELPLGTRLRPARGDHHAPGGMVEMDIRRTIRAVVGDGLQADQPNLIEHAAQILGGECALRVA